MDLDETVGFGTPDPEPARDELAKQTQYLDICNALELKSLEVSKAYKALNQLKTQEEALKVQREQLRKQLMGDEPTANLSKPVYPYGHRGSGRFA